MTLRLRSIGWDPWLRAIIVRAIKNHADLPHTKNTDKHTIPSIDENRNAPDALSPERATSAYNNIWRRRGRTRLRRSTPAICIRVSDVCMCLHLSIRVWLYIPTVIPNIAPHSIPTSAGHRYQLTSCCCMAISAAVTSVTKNTGTFPLPCKICAYDKLCLFDLKDKNTTTLMKWIYRWPRETPRETIERARNVWNGSTWREWVIAPYHY